MNFPPERGRQLYSGFYCTPNFGRNAELRISSICYSTPSIEEHRNMRLRLVRSRQIGHK
jgi:hypothetical protein